jgi:hypothetical protein
MEQSLLEREYEYLTQSSSRSDELRGRFMQFYLLLPGVAFPIVIRLAQLADASRQARGSDAAKICWRSRPRSKSSRLSSDPAGAQGLRWPPASGRAFGVRPSAPRALDSISEVSGSPGVHYTSPLRLVRQDVLNLQNL